MILLLIVICIIFGELIWDFYKTIIGKKHSKPISGSFVEYSFQSAKGGYYIHPKIAYEYEGEKYISISDDFVTEDPHMIPGQNVTIFVNSQKPDIFYLINDYKTDFIILCVCITLLVLILFGIFSALY